MARANPTDRDPVFMDEDVAGTRLTDGGSITILRFDDGGHRLMYERHGQSFGLHLSAEDLRNLRTVTGLLIHRPTA